MPKFGPESLKERATAHDLLQKLADRVVQTYDCKFLKGHRGREEQHAAFLAGNSKLDWPNGNHNAYPSKAMDLAPFVTRPDFVGVPWPDKKLRKKTYDKDLALFYHFAGYVVATAREMGIPIRWGGDWDSDRDLTDQNFDDLVHFELVGI